MLTEGTLKKWRGEALCDQSLSLTHNDPVVNVDFIRIRCEELSKRILRLTQELLDQHLMNKTKGK